MRKRNIAILVILILYIAEFSYCLTVEPVKADNTNIAVIPDYWGSWGWGYGIIYTSVLPPSQPQITTYDNTFTFGGFPTMRIDPYEYPCENTNREIDGNWTAVNVGDTIGFSGWIYCESSREDGEGRFGMDIFGAGGRITGKQSDGDLIFPDESLQGCQDNWVTTSGSWQFRKIEFTVPALVHCDGFSSGYSYMEEVEPIAVIPWCQAEPWVNDGSVWFANTTYWVNGDPIPTPTPTTTPSITPTPTPTIAPTINPDAFQSSTNVYTPLMAFLIFYIVIEFYFILEPMHWVSLIVGTIGSILSVYSLVAGQILPVQPYFTIFFMVWSMITILRSIGWL